VVTTPHPEIPSIGRADSADLAKDPSPTVGKWKALVMTEAGAEKRAAWSIWNPDDPRLTPEKDTGNPGITINWYWMFHPRQWWRVWRGSRRS
jgi:hypothetical protein